MDDEIKSRTPRWILLSTAVAGLIAAIFYAATKYYEFRKARVEADGLQAAVPAEKPSPGPGPGDKGVVSENKTRSPILTKGSIWEGFTDEGAGIRTRIEIDHCASGRFRGIMTTTRAGTEWFSAHIQGTITEENEVEFKTRSEDQFRGQRNLNPTYFSGVIRDNKFIGQWRVDSGANAPFILTRK